MSSSKWSQDCEHWINLKNSCKMSKSQRERENREINSIIDFCGEDWGCKDELLGGYRQSWKRCADASLEAKKCIQQGYIAQ